MQNSSTGEELGNAAKSATSDPAAEKNLFRFSVPGSQIPKTINNPSFPNLSSQLFPSSLPTKYQLMTCPLQVKKNFCPCNNKLKQLPASRIL